MLAHHVAAHCERESNSPWQRFAPAFVLIALRSGDMWWSWVFYALTGVGAPVLVVGGVLVATANTD